VSDGLDLKGAEDFERFAHALKAAGDRELRLAIGKRLREVGKPVAQRVLRKAAGEMPRRGGYASRVATNPIGVRLTTTSRNTSVALTFGGGRRGMDFKSLEAGTLRHPVFSRADRPEPPWVRQSVPAGAFSRAIDAERGHVQDAMLDALQDAVNTVARKA